MAPRLLDPSRVKETDMSRIRPFTVRLAAFALAAALMLPAAAGRADDTTLFSAAVAPNVLLVIDNSGSMNEVVWHPAYDPAGNPSCNYWDDDETYYVRSTYTDTPDDDDTNGFRTGNFSVSSSGCVSGSRNIFQDSEVHTLGGNPTRWDGKYLNWYYSAAADPYISQITSTTNGTFSSCLGGGSYPLYRRARVTAAKNILKDVICQVNQQGDVRFGLAQFRLSQSQSDGNGNDVNGGYVLVPINDYHDASGNPNVYTLNGVSDSHGDHLNNAIESLEGETNTPLAETLFQVYTYFMSRTTTNRPFGVNGTTRFPNYTYRPRETGVGGDHSTSGAPTVPDSPVQYACQKNFVILITDGEPTKDDFDSSSPTSTATGFSSYTNLIGDYNADGETETNIPASCNCDSSGAEGTLYLDDIAKFMHEHDFRLDLDGDQTLDVYTVGFTTTPFANALLEKTANVANGQYHFSNSAEALSTAIITTITDVIEKSQSFTAATVPASRTADGEQLYVSLFTPKEAPYWEGHLRSYRLTGAGEIFDRNGACAIDDPSGDCFSGSFLPVSSNPPYWDAADMMPVPDDRELRASVLRSGVPTMVEFVHEAPVGVVPPSDAVAAADLNVTWPVVGGVPTGSVATDAETYAAEVVGNVRGCEFGTGANGIACDERDALLGDIFHSNPVVVGQPPLFDPDPSYKAFKTLVTGRDRVIYAGDNSGFLHGFLAGLWQPTATPPQYNAGGTDGGKELFGFMPWPARQTIRHKPLDSSTRDNYYVDGSPTAADVWFYSSYLTGSKLSNGSEWRTILVGGLRQGGESFYALDVTNPAANVCTSPASGSGFPCYLWEFPRENDGGTYQDYVGQTWGDPIITRIRVDVGGEVMDRWVVVVSGGYHERSDPNAHASYGEDEKKGRSLWVLDAKTGEPLAWRTFDDAGDCSTSDPTVTDEQGMCYAFAATPAVFDTDGDRYADVIYAGDLGGNLWKWVIKEPLRLSDATTAADQNADWPFRKFFSAPTYTDGVTFYKSFYFPPAGTRKNSKIWLAIGTGERNDLLFMGDAGTTDDNNRFYVIEEIDLHDTFGPADVVTEPDLTDLTDDDDNCVSLGSQRGYFLVGSEGEKWVTNVEIFAGYVIANSYVSEGISTDPCEITGQAFLWIFRVECSEGFFQGSGGPTDLSRKLDIGAGLPTDPRVTVGASGDVSDRVITSMQGGGIKNLPPPEKKKSGALYWRELTD
jgi:type IV pilus assembly protein PilY1